MQEPRLRPDMLADIGQEGDDVVMGFLLDDPSIRSGLERALPQIALAASLGMVVNSAIASQACASISNQI